MGTSHNLLFHHPLHHFTFSLIFLFISFSTQLTIFTAEGITMVKPVGLSQEEKMILRGQIGSRPPRCERRCSSCGHCEAIQVPTNPQISRSSSSSSTSGGRKNSTDSTSTRNVAYSRGDDSSNYKPMSWKCKCGNFIFNP